MKQVLTIFLNEDKNAERIRKKYIPNYEKFKYLSFLQPSNS